MQGRYSKKGCLVHGTRSGVVHLWWACRGRLPFIPQRASLLMEGANCFQILVHLWNLIKTTANWVDQGSLARLPDAIFLQESLLRPWVDHFTVSPHKFLTNYFAFIQEYNLQVFSILCCLLLFYLMRCRVFVLNGDMWLRAMLVSILGFIARQHWLTTSLTSCWASDWN